MGEGKVTRDKQGRITCHYCEKPMKVVKIKDRKYAYCHGSYVSCGQNDIIKLELYWKGKDAS